MTMEVRWSFLLLLLLQVSALAARSHKGSQGTQGLSCLNDFVKTVSCSWNGTWRPDCRITAVRQLSFLKSRKRRRELITESCWLQQHRSSPPGCTLTFNKTDFNDFEVMPNISLECGGTLLETLSNYTPATHVKMNPPGSPRVNVSSNYTWISWSPGRPMSSYITVVEFQVQLIQNTQTWKEASTFFVREPRIGLDSSQLKAPCQARVRVRRLRGLQWNHWSHWSPTASWTEEPHEVAPQRPDLFWLKTGVLFSAAAVAMTLLLYGGCVINSRFRRLKGKPVPNPSQYFHTLQSVHKGNLKKWLNPLAASESFFTAEAPDPISPVEVCESWDVVPSSSPSSSSSSSTSALLHFHSYPSAGSDTSGIVDNFSSSSSSCFYNVGYFMSASSGSSGRTAPGPAYFTYKEDFHRVGNSRDLHISLCPSFTAPPTYESLKREPQSPDSGFGIDDEDVEERISEGELDLYREEVFEDPQTSSTFSPPMHQPSHLRPPPSASPPPHPHGLTDCQQAEAVAAAGGSYAAWPVAGAVCRSSSMPVEPCKTGYLTLKELQTTFSNKSI